MNASIKIFALLTACALAACGASNSASPKAPGAAAVATDGHPLDGSSYDVTLSINGKQPENDTLNFLGGRFESTACTAKGFPQWSEYRGESSEGAIAFHVVTHHPSGASIDWTGKVSGDVIDGTANVTMDGQTSAGTFHGAIKH